MASISSPKENINQLDEPVSDTLKRDFKKIFVKLKAVLHPKMKKEAVEELKDWDLWGPLILCLALALTVSFSSKKDKEVIFGTIFFIIWIGGFVVTLNAKFLGGKVSFFQSVCVLGYCVFPINLSALIIALTKVFLPFFVRALIVIAAFAWSTYSSIGFMQALVDDNKKLLAVYPVFLFYLFLSWFVLVV